MLISLHYTLVVVEAHLRALLPYFHDRRYIRIHNKPLFLVYRASRLPDPRATTALWRQLAQQHGLDGLYLVKVESFTTARNHHPELDGFDAALDFQPVWGSLPPPLQPPFRWKLLNKLGLARPHPFRTNRFSPPPKSSPPCWPAGQCPTPASPASPPPEATPPAAAKAVPPSIAQLLAPTAIGFVLSVLSSKT